MLSAVVLTKNSSLTISKTLSSLAWVDELYVLDDFSTDSTRDIAKHYTSHVVKRHLNADFSAQRNFGLSLTQGSVRNVSHSDAGGDWVLFVDSDEIVSEALQKEIRETISRRGTDQEGIHGYFLKRDDIFFGKKLQYGETAQVKLLRLAKKNAGCWKRPVHEYWDIKGRTETLNSPLIHTAHANVVQFISDINRYTTINAEYLYKKGENSNFFSIIAYPTGKFIQNYFMRLGFIDGTAGFVMAALMSFHSFLNRAKLYLLHHPGKS